MAAVVGLSAACGRVGFDNQGTEDADPAAAVDADLVAVVDADLVMVLDANLSASIDAGVADAATSFADPVRLRGLDSCQGNTGTVTIAGPTITTGTVLVVHAIQSFNTNGIIAVDSKGNNYQQLETQGQLGQRLHVLQSTIVTPLIDGDTITVTFERTSDSAVVVTEIVDVASTAFSTQSSFDSSESIIIDYTEPATGVMLCVGGIRGGSVEMLGKWNELINTAEDCGGGGAGQTTFAYWAPAGQNAGDSCQASLIPGEGVSKWAGAVVGFEP